MSVSKSYTLTHQDGSTEKVLLSTDDDKKTYRDHIMIVYFTLGTVVLLMTAYGMYRKFKK